MPTYRDSIHLGRKVPLVEGDDILRRTIKGCNIAPGAIQGRHIAPGSIPVDAVFKDFVLPWFDIETDENGDEWLVAFYADDGAIKDVGMDEDTGEIWVIVSDGEPLPYKPDMWQKLSFHDYKDRRVTVVANLENVVCPVDLQENGECTVLYENPSETEDFTVSISHRYKTADGEAVVLTVPHGGYGEVSYLRSGGQIYVRGA